MTKKKWLRSRETECWDAFVDTCPQDSRKCDKVPNWARRSLGLATHLGRVPGAFPLSLQHVTDDMLLEKLQLGMEVSPPGICDLIKDLLEEYNEQVRQVNLEIEKHVEENPDDVDAPKPVPLSTCRMTRGCLEKLAARFARRFNWHAYRNEKPGRHLEFNDPQVVAIRGFIAASIASGKCHERLVANFDQIWTLAYEPLKKVAWKSNLKAGERTLEGKFPRKARMIQELRSQAGLLPSKLGFL